MLSVWRVRLDRLYCNNSNEDGTYSDGDEPVMGVIGFNSTFATPGST